MLQFGTFFYKAMTDSEFFWELKWNEYFSVYAKKLLPPSKYLEPVDAALWLLLEYVYGSKDNIKYSLSNQVLSDKYLKLNTHHQEAVLEVLKKNLPLSGDALPKHKPLLNKILADLDDALLRRQETPREGGKLNCILKAINKHYKTLPSELNERFCALMNYEIPSDRKEEAPDAKSLAKVYLYLCTWGFTTIRLTQVFHEVDKTAFITENLNWTSEGLLIRDCYARLLNVEPAQIDPYIGEIQQNLFDDYRLKESDFAGNTENRTIDYQHDSDKNTIKMRFRTGDYQSEIYTMYSSDFQSSIPDRLIYTFIFMRDSYQDVACFLKEKDTHFADFIDKLSPQPSQAARKIYCRF